MLQYKLFKLHIDGRNNTIDSLKKIFGEEKIWIISEKVIAIFYDYGVYDYKYVLKQSVQFNISQVIINSNTILQFMELMFKNNCVITELNFAKSISLEDKEFINKSIRLITIEKDPQKKNDLKKIIFKELTWLTTDGCIDINYIETEIKSSESNKFFKTKLYNNGVLIVQNIQAQKELEYIFDKMDDII